MMRGAGRKGISPVIATVILVAVTLTVALSIAYWMGGIAGLYTRFEKVEVVYANAQTDKPGAGWNITLKIKNTGSASTTIDNILLNGVPLADVNGTKLGSGDSVAAALNSSGDISIISISLNSGDEVYIVIFLPSGAKMGSSIATSGLSVEVKLHTTGGKDYPVLVTLP